MSEHFDAKNERNLFLRLQARDERAAEILVRENVGWMLALARRYLSDRALAEDCVQDVFLNVFNKIGEFDGRSTLKSWMHRIVVNSALTKLRSRQRENCYSIEDLMPAFDENGCRLEMPWYNHEMSTSAEILEQKDLRAFVVSKINELPSAYRIVVLLKDIEELSTSEVADILELDEGNVRVRLHRARAALKRLLEPVLRGNATA